MSGLPKARAEARALLSVAPYGVAAGAVVGLAVGCAYLAGGMARNAMINAENSKIADAAKNGISDTSLRTLAADDPGSLTVALRYDPALIAGYGAPDHQAQELADALGGKIAGPANAFLRQTVAINFNPAARPFHASMLDQSRQMDCLAQAVYYEARGDTSADQAAVAQVVLNRVRHPAFPKSICAVVFQGADVHNCQFSFACDGSMDQPREPDAWRRAKTVAARALSGYVMPEVGNATHFHLATITTPWDGMMKVAEVGAHVFYRFNGLSGLPGAFNGKPHGDPAPAAKTASPIFAAVALDPQPVTAPSPATAQPPYPVATPAVAPAASKDQPMAELKVSPAA